MFRSWLGGGPSTGNPKPGAAPSPSGTTLDDAAVERLMAALTMTRDDELSCAEVFALLDEYAELAVGDEDRAAALMPLMEMHLEMCTDCDEYYEALRGILESRENRPADHPEGDPHDQSNL